MPHTLVAIPALNEAATIRAVIAEVRRTVPAAQVLVIDDGSTDGTGAVARHAGAKVVTMPFNVGVGGAMRTAFLYAQRHNFDLVVQVDADGQHVAEYIPRLVAALEHASVAVGARFLGGYEVRGPRRWAMQALSRSLTKVCNTRLTDTTSGFRASDRRAIALFAQHYPAEYLGDTVESLVLASRSGLVITEIPVVMRTRQGGRPSQSPMQAMLYLVRAILALYVALARRSVPIPSTPIGAKRTSVQ